jgi:hypothetical protein
VAQKKLKRELVEEYDCLDIMSESQPLLHEEFSRMKQIAAKINSICAMEEIKARQRSREK